jgi:hypothetical protein
MNSAAAISAPQGVALMQVRQRLWFSHANSSSEQSVLACCCFRWLQLASMRSEQEHALQQSLDAGLADVLDVGRKLRPLAHLPAEGLSSMVMAGM